MIYSHKRKINFLDLDANKNIRLTALIKYINEASWESAESLGAGMETTLQFDMVFILQRLAVKKIAPINQDDILNIRTWPGEMTRSAFKRQGDMLNEKGEKVLEWESMWVLVDVASRKIKRPTESPVAFELQGRNGVEIEADKVKLPTGIAMVDCYHHCVRFSELDMYGHMNSAIYGDLVANGLQMVIDEEMGNFDEVQFNYMNEAVLNDNIHVQYYRDETGMHVKGVKGETTVFVTQLKGM